MNIRVPEVFLLILSLGSSFVGPQSNVKTEPRRQDTSKMIQQLAAGNHSSVTEPFVFVARDVETYSMLRKMLETLPRQEAKFFESNAVIAAFLGQRPTGGYSVDIAEGDRRSIVITERRPPKGTMVTTVLTAPYKVVAVEVGQNAGLMLSLGERWQAALRHYAVTNGEVTVTGGFAGKTEQHTLQGAIDVMRAGKLATLFFNVQGSERGLLDVASGKVDQSKFVLKGVDSFGLARAINSPFQVSGEFSDEGRQLVLRMETVPSPYVSDNFGAAGTLQAAAVK